MKLEQLFLDSLRSWVPPRSKLLCAISGGPDSVALAHLLKSSPYHIILGHVDHQMRAESANEARFVQSLARRWGLPCEVTRVNVRRHVRAQRLGLEEAARELRYQALVIMAKKTSCSALVTAHSADDQAETVLMNFLRGAGPQGLAGIPPQRELVPGLNVLRPLLNTPRSVLIDYVKKHHLPYRMDASNRSLRFTRNRIRLQVLPRLETLYPGLKRRLVALAEIFREEEAWWAVGYQREFNKTVRQNSKKITVDLTQLLGYHKALGRRILRRLFKGLSFQDTERVLQLARFPDGNPSIQLSGGLFVQRKGNMLIIPSRGRHG